MEVDQCLADYLVDGGLLNRPPPAPVELQPTETLGVDELPQVVPGDALTDVSILKALGHLLGGRVVFLAGILRGSVSLALGFRVRGLAVGVVDQIVGRTGLRPL